MNKLVNIIFVLLLDVFNWEKLTFSKLVGKGISRKENLKKGISFEEQKGTRYIRGNVHFGIIIFSCCLLSTDFYNLFCSGDKRLLLEVLRKWGCSSIKFLHFDFSRGDGGTTTWTIFMCPICFSFCWWDLVGRFIVGTVFSFQVFFPTPNSLFVILFHFQERKKAQQACQLSRCYWESASLNRFRRVYWIINFLSLFQNNLSFGNYL